MNDIDFIIIAQSEIVNYQKYSKLPIERLSLYSNLIYPRMVYFKGGFRSHLDIINWFRSGNFFNEVEPSMRRQYLSIWNLPGFNGINLANYLKSFGLNTGIINNFDAEWDVFCDMYEKCEKKPLVGISTTFHLNYSEIARICKCLKGEYPEISIVLGGAFTNDRIQAEDTDSLTKAMKKYGIDFALHGFNSEIDLKELRLWRRWATGEVSECVKNLAYLLPSGNGRPVHLTKTSWNPPVTDQSPPFWHHLDLPFVNNTIQMRTSSGCHFSCAFCSYPQLARGFHPMSVDICEEHIKSVLRLPSVNKIIFIDDTFNVPIDRFKQLCKMFAKYDFEWFSFLRVQYIDEETAMLMKSSGCRGVYLTIESANDMVLKRMNKKATRAQYAQGIEWLKKYDITMMAAFIIGFPGENEGTIRDNIEFIEKSGVDFYTLKEFYYMESTPVYQKKDEYGLSGMGSQWSHDTMNSEAAFEHKITMFREIKNSVFMDPDTSLWYLAYLYDQGFSIEEIRHVQKCINSLMLEQLDGTYNDKSPIYDDLANIIHSRG